MSDANGWRLSYCRVVCRTAYNQRVTQTRQFMEAMNDPNRKAEAEQFLRSRVQAADQKPEGEQ